MMLIKIGGGESIDLEATIADLATLEQPFMVVHGVNVLRDQLAQRLGIEKTVLTSVSGYNSVFSDQPALDVIMMSYSGLRNKQIVELCQRSGINAVGLTGLDGRLVHEHVRQCGAAWDPDRLSYLSNWVTPEGLAKRFDTRFYLAVVESVELGPISPELETVEWMSPQTALDRYQRDEIELILPTLAHLRMLVPFPTTHGPSQTWRPLSPASCAGTARSTSRSRDH